MKEYPSIEKMIRFGEKVYAFDKLDGSNIRSEWCKKNGFWKFGTRTQLIDIHDSLWGQAPKIINEKYAKDLHDIFVKNRFDKVICFFEFWGKNSFAGTHADEEHYVTLFDISVHKKGILPPPFYLDLVGHLDIAKMLYYGNANQPFAEQVRQRQLEGMTFEGVVCKGQIERPGLPMMFKIKSLEWTARLKEKCKGDEKLFEKLV